jgi:hypothetical protein
MPIYDHRRMDCNSTLELLVKSSTAPLSGCAPEQDRT